MTLLILRHLTTRVLIAIPLLLAVTLGTFLMLYSIGDPAAALAGEGATNAQIQEIRVAYGLDKPVLQQYATWLGNTLSGDLGSSMANKGSVSELVGDYLPPTLMLSAYAMLIATVTAVIMGSVVGSRPGGITDKIMQGISLLGVAIPNFLLALLLILIFAIQFQFLPPGGYRTPESVGLAETLKYLTLPALSLALSLMCLQTRTFRASLIEQYRSDYVRTARMKGAQAGTIFFRHVARNAAAPLVTVIGLEVGVLITGALLVEVVFAVPGVGTLTIESVRGQDFPVVQALVALFGAVVLGANLIADLVALWLNPVARSKA